LRFFHSFLHLHFLPPNQLGVDTFIGTMERTNMSKIFTFLCLASLAFIIGSAGALETSVIGLEQGIVQMGIGTFGFWASARELMK